MSASWPQVPLCEILEKSKDSINIQADTTYREVTVRMWGKGVVLRREVLGAEMAAPRRAVVKMGQFILSRIDARNGAFGLIPESLDGAVVSNDFPTFNIMHKRLDPRFLEWLSKTNSFIDLCKAASEGTTNRVRLKEEMFLSTPISLPPLTEQQRIVERIHQVSARLIEVKNLRNEIIIKQNQLLASSFTSLIAGAKYIKMSDIAPLVRRPVKVNFEQGVYPELGVRSFGKGTFHKPALCGADVGTKKLFQIEPGDLVFSNVFAWEGAIAVAKQKDIGRFGSHRFITCVPDARFADASFLLYYFLTPKGLQKIGEASPGGAGRNRTLGLKTLEDIEVPLPSIERQIWFRSLLDKVEQVRIQQESLATETGCLLPSILDKAFKGQLTI